MKSKIGFRKFLFSASYLNRIFRNRLFSLVTYFMSYTTAVSLFSALVGGTLAIVVIVFIWPEIEVTFPEKYVWWMKVILFIPWLKHFVFFGGFKKLGFMGIHRSVIIINQSVEAKRKTNLRADLSASQLKRFYYSINRLPRLLYFHALFDIAVTVILLFVCAFFYNALDVALLWIPVTGLLAYPVYAGITFSLSESVTGDLRAQCLRRLRKKGVTKLELSRSTIRIKQLISHGLLISGILITNMITYHNNGNLKIVLIFALLVFVTTLILSQNLFQMIVSSLKSAERAVNSIRKGRNGLVFNKVLDREFDGLMNGINNASDTIQDFKNNMKRKVRYRTQKLKDLNFKLRDAFQELKAKEDILEMELRLAAEVQSGLLQTNLESWNNISFEGTYLPKIMVSGDYMDIFRFREVVFILMADVSGHGVPAALITMAAKEIFNSIVSPDKTPAEILALVNRQLVEKIKTQDYITAFMLKLDHANNLTYCNASHQYALHYSYKEKKVYELDTEGVFLGALEEDVVKYEDKSLQLQAGDRVILYTDGLLEGKKGSEIYGHERLIEHIKVSNTLDLSELHNTLIVSLNIFMQGNSFQDDVSLLSLEVSQSSDHFNALLIEGIKLYESQNLSQALTCLFDAYKIVKRDPILLITIVNILFLQKDFHEAKKYFEEYILIFKPLDEDYRLSLQIYWELKDKEKLRYYLNRFKAVTSASDIIDISLINSFEQKLKTLNF